MDPFTILATAKAATEGIKKAIAIGKDFHEIIKDMSALMKAEGDLAKLAANPPRGWGQSGSAEEIAMQAVSARKQVESMTAQIKNEFMAQYGMHAWDEVLREIIKVRKQQKEAALKAAKERADQMRLIMFAVPTVGIPFIILIIVAIAIISN
jgi:hypothetical protein